MYFLVSLMILIFAGTAKTDIIMFPIIIENPGVVSTIISVVNGITCISNSVTPVIPQTLIWSRISIIVISTKPITSLPTEYLDKCLSADFCRQTSLNDLVTFDAAGHIGSGITMFGDPGAGLLRPYISAGGVLINGSFTDPLVPSYDFPRRGYLLVTHANGGCYDLTSNTAKAPLDGEAVLIDLLNGGSFSYRAFQNYLSQYAHKIVRQAALSYF